MQNFEQYERSKQSLLRAYQLVLDSDLLPIDETGPEQVLQRMRDLEAGRFLVAVCGRIKAGKSTLLNALLFGDWVMPTDDMPLTAKNTLVEYGEREALEITFFSTAEWAELTAQLPTADEVMRQQFFAEVDQAAALGVHVADWVLPQARVERYEQSSADLKQFVTPVKRGGKFTPFVKQVRLMYPHPWLRSVTIADTPGVDDPYKFREDQTKQFVTRAGAVLFATYAGQAMSQPDFDFLNDYLVHVPKHRRLIAVNKIDTLKKGSADLDAYLRGLMDHPEPAINSVFGNRDSVHMVCGLGALIAQCDAAGRPIPEDYEFYREQLGASGHLEPHMHGVDKLREKVEERLVRHEGASIILDHSHFLTSLFERKGRRVKSDLSLNRSRLEDVGKSQQELQHRIAEIKKQLETMKRTLNVGKSGLKKANEKRFHRLGLEFGEMGKRTRDRTEQKLREETQIGTLATKAIWCFGDSFDAEKPALERVLESCITGIEGGFGDLMAELRGNWAGSASADYMDTMLSYSMYDTLDVIGKLKGEIAVAEKLDKLRLESTAFYQRWFNTRAGREAAATAMLHEMGVKLQAGLDAQFSETKLKLVADIDRNLEAIEEQLRSVQQGRLEDLERLTQGTHNSQQEHAQLEVEIAEAERRLKHISELELQVNDAMR